MELLPQSKESKHDMTKLTIASMEFVSEGFPENDPNEEKVVIAMCIAVSLAKGNIEGGLAQAICNRFRRVEDFDRGIIKNLFELSIANERTRVLLGKALIHKKKRTGKDIQHEFNVEFVLLFFGILESLVRRGKHLDELGYVTPASPSNMRNAQTTLEEHVTWIATRCGECFKLDALKEARPRVNLFPKDNAFPVATIGCKPINLDTATVDTLQQSLFDTMRDEFHDIYVGIKFNTVKEYFLEKILDKTVADGVLDKTSAAPPERRPKKSFAKANKKVAHEAQVREEEMQHLRGPYSNT